MSYAILVCCGCGSTYHWQPRRGGPPRYCSDACREQAAAQRAAARKRVVRSATCRICGAVREEPVRRGQARRICGQPECVRAARRERMVGEVQQERLELLRLDSRSAEQEARLERLSQRLEQLVPSVTDADLAALREVEQRIKALAAEVES